MQTFAKMLNTCVGSANAQLDDHIKQLPTRVVCGSFSSRLASYLTNMRHSNEQADSKFSFKDFDFKLVKINCKKESDCAETKTKMSTEVKHFGLLVILVVFLSMVAVSLGFYVKQAKLNKLLDKDVNLTNIVVKRRSVNIYSTNKLVEWSNEKIPTIYELNLSALLSPDGGSDEVHIKNQLKYIKYVLRINCVQLTGAQAFYNLSSNYFLSNPLHSIQNTKAFNGLRELIEIAHLMSIRVGIGSKFERDFCIF